MLKPPEKADLVGVEAKMAFAYMRTSSATNVGDDKDSVQRQRAAIQLYAKRAGFEIVEEFYDAAVSGGDEIEIRPEFGRLLDRVSSGRVRTVLVEDVSRFARSLMAQEGGLLTLIKRGVTVLTAGGENLTETDDPMKKAMRQIAGVFSELEKHRIVSKLKAARDRKRATGVKVEGRKSYAERDPEMVALARRLYRRSPKTGDRRSLRTISKMMAESGYTAKGGEMFTPESIRRMVR